MLTISGYQISDPIYESNSSSVYRGWREADGQPVILKTLKETHPSPERIAWFQREFEVTRTLNPGVGSETPLRDVVEVYHLEVDQHRLVMIVEDFGGESLAHLNLAGQFTLPDFLQLAINITDILGQIHQRQIIHKDINPANIVFNPQTRQVKLIDFGISTQLSRETTSFRSPNLLQGTPAYISPEQTGRMNRAVDYRTDFYSLGVTFYELLTGKLPFRHPDPLELIHSHIARDPEPPHHIQPNLPPMLSEIILKLMSKNAEDRYQSAFGLKADLTTCLDQVNRSNEISTFTLASQDILDRFQLPQKLYGRDEEVEILLSSFERVSQGATEIVLVSGNPGVGKSMLVQEVYKPITQRRGYFISGKFDQFQRNIPYASLISAFQMLVSHILTETDAEITRWRRNLRQALGANGQVIIDIIPEVEFIIGSQPALPDLGPTEAQNRFNLTFQNFIKVFTAPEHPLTLFLDDLQWADSASLKLLSQLLISAMPAHLFFIGAYRDNEVNDAHPLMLTLAEMQKANLHLQQIALVPLTLAQVAELLGDALTPTTQVIQPLAEAVLAKTNGNPFFLGEFLMFLSQEALISFHHQQSIWQWDLARIQAQAITDNVISLMADKVERLPGQAQRVIKLAACIGNQFDLKTLAIIAEQSPHETAADLWPAIVAGLILPLNDAYKLMELEILGLAEDLTAEYKFVHDRVQQGVYSLIPGAKRQVFHHRIGQLLLSKIPSQARGDHIFAIVNHLNQGSALIEGQEDRDALAELNLQAGRRARASAAYEAAFAYFEMGLDLINPIVIAGEAQVLVSHPRGRGWRQQYALTLALHQAAIEAAYLNADVERMDVLIDTVLQVVDELLDKVEVYEIRIKAYTATNRMIDAFDTALEVLALLDLPLPRKPAKWQVNLSLFRVRLALLRTPIETILTLPPMTNAHIRAAKRIIASAGTAIYLTTPNLIPLTACETLRWTLKYGNDALASVTYVTYGFILCAILDDVKRGYQFGRLALDLMAQEREALPYKARTIFTFNTFIHYRQDHAQTMVPAYREAYQTGLETGDVDYAIWSAHGYYYALYFTGRELATLEQEIAVFSEVFQSLNQEMILYASQLYRQIALNWLGEAETPWRLAGEIYDEAQMLPIHMEAQDYSMLSEMHIQKMVLCCFFHRYQEGVDNAAQAETYLDNLVGLIQIPIFYAYDSLARLGLYDAAAKPEQQRILQRVAANQKILKKYADHAPMNFQHTYDLIEAERCRVTDDEGAARIYYDKAIISAQENGYIQEQALGNELAARFYLARRHMALARAYLHEARYAYTRWGAKAKIKDLETQYAQLFDQSQTGSLLTTIMAQTLSEQVLTTSNTGTQTGLALDLDSVLKASQAIAGEIEFAKLLTTLMNIVIENAGAEHGFLLLPRDGQWVVEAEGHIDRTNVTVLQSLPIDEIAPTTAEGNNGSHSRDLPLTVINFVARTAKEVVLHDALHAGDFTQDRTIIRRQPKSVLCMPLINQGQLRGLLYLENNLTPGAFTPDRLEVLTLLSSQVAIAIENAQLYATLQASEKQYRTLFEDSRDVIYITKPNGEFVDINPAGQILFGYSEAEIRQIRAQDLYVLEADLEAFLAEISSQGAVKDFGVKLRHKDGSVIDCLMTATLRRSDDGTILSYEGIIRDITEYKRAEQQRLQLSTIQRELSIARGIQQTLLPDLKPNWPDLDVICHNVPAREVGGDFYSYHTFEPQATQASDSRKYALAVGDVSGKGVSAALLMATSLSQFDASLHLDLTPASRMTHLDQAIQAYIKHRRDNCAMCYAEFELRDSEIVIMRAVNAGCMQPYIKRSSGEVEELEVGGFALGQGLGVAFGYQPANAVLTKGDLVILTTDGVVEANNAQDDMFGFERLNQALEQGPTTSSEAMMTHLLREISTFVGQADPHDDLTIIVVQV